MHTIDIPRHPAGTTASRGGKFAPRKRITDGLELRQPVSLDIFREQKELSTALNGLITVFDTPLSEGTKARLSKLTKIVTERSWADARGILLTPDTTLWQAIIRHTNYSVTALPVNAGDYNGFNPFQQADRAQTSRLELPNPDEVRYAIIATHALASA